MDSVHVLRVLMRSWLIIGLFTIAGAAGGLLVYANTAPEYQSSVQLLVSAPSTKNVDPLTQQAVVVDRTQVAAEVASKAPAVADAESAAGHAGVPVSVTASAQTTGRFLTIVVQGADPSVVQAIADAYGDTLPGTLSRVENGTSQAISVTKVGPASFSADPYAPHLLTDLLPGLAAGFVFGAGLVILRELLNQSIDTADELQTLTGLRILGSVPRDTPKVPLPSITEPRSLRAEAYRQVRTAVLTSTARPARSIAVTSSLAREGKTSVSTNLAVSLARAGASVALVDADLHRPQVAEFMQISPDVGLIDVLTGTADIADALISMEDGGLHVLTSGHGLAEPSELLFNERLDEVIKHLSAEHEFVIVDTPPVLPVADALVIAPRMDAVILVAQLGRTRRDEIKRTRTAITDAGVPILGVVANQARRGGSRRYRYYYSAAPGLPDGKAAGPTVAAAEPEQARRRPRPPSRATATTSAATTDPDTSE